jgi:hypothetical protein
MLSRAHACKVETENKAVRDQQIQKILPAQNVKVDTFIACVQRAHERGGNSTVVAAAEEVVLVLEIIKLSWQLFRHYRR